VIRSKSVLRHPRRRPRPGLLAATLLGALLLAGTAPAAAFIEDPATGAKHRLLFTSLTAGQYNPLGLQTDLLTGYRYRLFRSEKLILRDTFVGARQVLRINPAYVRVGAMVEVQPAAVFMLRAFYEHRDYFGSANMLQSYASPGSANRRADLGLKYAGRGHQLWLQVTLRMKVGPVAFLNETEIHDFRMSLRRGDRVFYDAFFDTLVPGNGWLVANHAHVVVFARPRLLLGLRYTVAHALYPDSWLDPAVGNVDTPNHKVGPVAAYVFPSRSRYFKAPTLIALANWWFKNRYRTGQAVSQAIPYAILAFQWSGELWSR
jgi:hypothetical protein